MEEFSVSVQERAMQAERMERTKVNEKIESLVDNIEKIIFGKRDVIKLCVVGLLARGHILIDDIPGIGKTTLAQGLARSIDCAFNRIQFTSDMLPADIIGVSILDPATSQFEFRPGPIFSNVVLADEINRTPPKTQSALLEAMSEFHVTVDGKTRPLPDPFIVLATQNPIEYEGTYILPEAQLDRFLLRIEIGYPDVEDELRIVRRHDALAALRELTPVLTAKEVLELQTEARAIHVDESVEKYILAIITATRNHENIRLGASPRGSLALYEASQAHAMVDGRDYVTPGDVKAIAIPVLSHRILTKAQGGNLVSSVGERKQIVVGILESISIPV